MATARGCSVKPITADTGPALRIPASHLAMLLMACFHRHLFCVTNRQFVDLRGCCQIFERIHIKILATNCRSMTQTANNMTPLINVETRPGCQAHIAAAHLTVAVGMKEWLAMSTPGAIWCTADDPSTKHRLCSSSWQRRHSS